MDERDFNKMNTEELGKSNNVFNEKYELFFEYSPISLWIEDFSKVKSYLNKIAKESNLDINSYLSNYPKIIPELVSMVEIKEVNESAVKLYNASSKEHLLKNIQKVFTEKSNIAFSKLLLDILKGVKKTEIETVNLKLTGEEINTLLKFQVADGSEETLANVIVSVEDITDQVKIRKELNLIEKRVKYTQEINKIGSWFYDFENNEIHWSDEIYYMMELEPQKSKLSLDYYLGFVHEDDKKLVDNFSINDLIANPNQLLSYRVITSKGELKYISEKRSTIIENGKIIRLIGITQDITENILSEQDLNKTKNLLTHTLSGITDGFVIVDLNSNYTYINQKAESFLGKTEAELLGKNIWTEFPEKEGDIFYDSFQKAIETKKPISFENYFEPFDRWFENRIIPSDDGIMMFFHEITEKKQSANKIRQAYNIINKSSSVAFLCDNKYDFPVVFASENSINLFGYGHKEFLSGDLKIHQIVLPDDLPIVRLGVFELVASTNLKGFKPKPFRIVTKSGNIKWVKTNIDVIRNNKNEITHIQGIVEDYTEQKNTEDLFFKSNQQLQDQFNNTPLASIIWDVNFKVLEWNNSAQRIFGYSAEEAKSHSIKNLLVPPMLVHEMKVINENLLGGVGNERNTNTNITKSGKSIICDWYNVSLKDSDGNVIGVASLVDDVTERNISKKLLEKSEKKYRDIFEKSIDAVFIIKEGAYIDCNAASIKMFGYTTKDSLLQLHPSQISPTHQPNGISSFEKSEKLIKKTLEEGSNRFRWYHKRKNGEVFPTEITLTKIDDIDNKSTIHAVIKDITERVKKEELENVLYNISRAASEIEDFNEFSFSVKNELHKILDTSNFFIALYDEETDMLRLPIMVDEMEDITDFPAEKSLTGYVIKNKKPLLLTSEDHNKLIEQKEVELIGLAAKIWVGVPLKIQGKVFGAIVVQSYTNENAYSQNDLQLLEFVADQISITIQRKNTEDELRKALSKAQESDRLKSSFLANMSHEIRTPMNGIIGFSELFLEPTNSENDRNKYANIVINSSKQLLNIVNDILDISKIEAGVVKLNYESVSINNLLEDLYSFYKPIATSNKLTLNCKKGLDNNRSFIEIDQLKLNQVLTNLLSNSFKFTDEGSVDFGYELKEDMLEFYVKDTGSGIDKSLHNVIFDRFIQANLGLNKQTKGTGLGLAISKKFIELFNGKIWLESDNYGTSIYFTIPYIKAKSKPIISIVEEKTSQNQIENMEITILIAEDEEYNMLYINELFSNMKIKIIEAENGKIAVEMAEKHPEIDLVFMDIKMPIMNGFEAMTAIKKNHPKLPIIALSAFAMESDKENALKKGFNDYLSKPIDRKKLFEFIEKYTNSK